MLKERLEEEGEITVLGGGFIGLELAGKVIRQAILSSSSTEARIFSDWTKS